MWVESNLIGTLILAGAFACLIAVAEAWRAWGTTTPESVRKLVHIGGGFGCLTYPFLVSDHRIVLGMAVGFASLFLVSKKLGILQSLHGVDRATRGSEYFPVAIWLVFWVSQDHVWLYISTILVLTLADGFAAIVGTRLGRIRFRISADSEKSLEGSLAFLGVAFVAIFIPLRLMTPFSLQVCLYSSILVAILLTCMEAVSVRGTDNIFVPVLCCYVLQKITTKPVAEIGFQVMSLVVILLVISLVIWRTRTLNAAGALILICATYACWSLGSIIWAIPILIGFSLYVVTCIVAKIDDNNTAIRTGTVFAVLAIPLTILVYANAIQHYDSLYGPFLGAVIVAACMILWETYSRAQTNGRGRLPTLVALVAGVSLAVLLPLKILIKNTPWQVLALYSVTAFIFSMCHVYLKWDEHGKQGPAWTPQRFLLTILAAAALFSGQKVGLWPAWNLNG